MMSAVITLLAILHVATAVGWLGALAFFLSSVGPGLRTLSPAARLEYLAMVGPRQTRFFVGTATGTIVFGLALLFTAFPNTSTWPTSIEIGFVLGFIAYLIALGVTVPAFRNADKAAHKMLDNAQGPPSPELGAQLAAHMKRGNMGAVLVGILLILALVFMVETGFPF